MRQNEIINMNNFHKTALIPLFTTSMFSQKHNIFRIQLNWVEFQIFHIDYHIQEIAKRFLHIISRPFYNLIAYFVIRFLWLKKQVEGRTYFLSKHPYNEK